MFARASLGVITSEWTTLFGPPSTLTKVEALPELSSFAFHSPHASSAVHSPQLSELDVEYVVGAASCLEIDSSDLAPSPDTPGRPDTLREALSVAVSEIANRPLHLEAAIHALAGQFTDERNIELLTIGSSTHDSLMTRVLKAALPNIEIAEANAHHGRDERYDEDCIAIVGMSGRFPQADNLDEFWALLETGLPLHEDIPSSRFKIDDFHDPLGERPNSTGTRFGCFLRNPGLFDHAFFHTSPKEALEMDPLQRMLLMSTYEALQQAGYSPDSTPSTQRSRIATFFGQTTSDWATINEQRGIGTHYISGTNRAFTPGRLNHYFQWGGGYYSIDTACSASSTSIHLASNALLARECDTAIVGGGQLCTVPDMFAGLSSGGFLSSTGACKTFSDDADGYCRGEAVGVVVMKRLSDAIRENDSILAIVRGTARNTNGVHGSIVSPHQPAQEALFRKVLRKSGVHKKDIDYIEVRSCKAAC